MTLIARALCLLAAAAAAAAVSGELRAASDDGGSKAAGGAGGAGKTDWSVALDVPPGWEDVTGQRSSADIVAALAGPEGSSFVLAKLKPAGLSDAAGKRALLLDVLSGVNRKTGLSFLPKRELKTATYKNDVAAHYIQADLDGKPRMILAITEFRGRYMLGTIKSSVPDTLLPSILGSIQYGAGGRDQRLARRGTSVDGQLAFALPEGVWLRAVSARERNKGMVAVILGYDSVMSVTKLDEIGSSATEEAGMVKYVLKSVKGVDNLSVSLVQSMSTPAGPGLLYAWAKVKSEAGQSQAAAGFMPWGYWGYSLWASGPRSKDLLESAMKSLAAGPSADKKILDATPRLATTWGLRTMLLTGLGAALAAVVLLVVAGRLAQALLSRKRPVEEE
ncbi:MAG: hypothetical protein HY927_04330 [Elusimicrobia bacterium]|nr:hypothetical protein [Elusimicrobiota bacterium]